LKKIILLLILINFCFADIVQKYREDGINAVISELDNILMSENYWRKYLDSVDTKIGFFEKDIEILLANKSKKELKLFSYKNSKLHPVTKYSSIFGKNGGEKTKEGDLKTPNGSYMLTSKLIKVDPFYGPFAFVTSYPNLYDRSKGKGGHGIWVHGFPMNKQVRETNTKGCVALDNNLLVDLDKRINHKKTIIIINETDIMQPSKSDLAIILSNMYKWKRAWERSDINEYLSFYDKDFLRFDGMNLTNFSKYKQLIFSRKEQKIITFKEFIITPNPTVSGENIYRVGFYETYIASSHKFNGYKEIFVKVEKNKMKIVTEQ